MLWISFAIALHSLLVSFFFFSLYLDAAPAEAVKRKVTEADAPKSEEIAEVTPEKKAKLEEASKEDVQNGAETTEVAA